MLEFRNRGVIDLRAVTTIGVSAKEPGAIGFFGTGLKYAIASILRNNGSIRIVAGGHLHEFSARPEIIRGKEFHVVQHHDRVTDEIRPLGFTTHLGVNWEPWQVFRELYCNALDEGGAVADHSTAPPGPDETVVLVEGWPDLQNIYHERHLVVLQTAPLHTFNGVEIHPLQGAHTHYRRVRAGKLSKQPGWTYNITAPMQLTEDRTFAYDFMVHHRLAAAILAADDPVFLEQWLTRPRDSFEGEFNLKEGAADPGPVFMEVMGRLSREFARPVNSSAREVFREHRGLEAYDLVSVELNQYERRQLDQALELLRRMGYDIDPARLHVLQSLGTNTLGMAFIKTGQIAISRKAFEIGVKCLAGTILEEHLHVAMGYEDHSRDLQNYLLDRLVNTAVHLHMPEAVL